MSAAPVVKATPTVITPFGRFPVANVHAVPEGGHIKHVGNEVHLVDASGKVIHIAQHNDHIPVRKAATLTSSDAVAHLQTGKDGMASWTNTTGSPISWFTATWTVPDAPATNHGQTIFLWNGIEPTSGAAVLQPVLQWRSAGGWALASWYALSSGEAYYSWPIPTSSGTEVTGVMTMISSSGGSFDYACSFTGVPGTDISVKGVEELQWAMVLLEPSGVETKSDLPPGSTVFSRISLKTSAGTPDVTWKTKDEIPGPDDTSTTINAQGATNAVITIKY